VYCDIWYIFLIPQFLRHQTMDKVQKHNLLNFKVMFNMEVHTSGNFIQMKLIIL